jgi:hypothetical protein
MRATRACATIGPGSAALCKARPFVLQEPLLLLLLPPSSPPQQPTRPGTMSKALGTHLAEAITLAINRGPLLKPALEALGLNTCAKVCAMKPSFLVGPNTPTDLAAALTELQAAPLPSGTSNKWAKATTAHLNQLVNFARLRLAAEAAAAAGTAVVPPTGTLGAAPPPALAVPAATLGATATVTPPSVAAANEGFGLYELAEQVYGQQYTASDRVKYEVIGKLSRGMQAGRPVAYALNEYAKEYSVREAAQESFEFAGATFVSKDGSAAKVKVDTASAFLDQVDVRAHAYGVAGSFSAKLAATARHVAPPTAAQSWPESTKSYVTTSAAGAKSVAVLDCYASMAGQAVEAAALRTFFARNPHCTLAGIRAIDHAVESRVADEMLRGCTRDAAVQLACVKSPELYSAANLPPESDKSSTAAGADKAARKRADERSEDEQLTSAKRRIDQQVREIANLKGGKGGKGGKGAGKGGGKGGGGWQQGQSGYQAWYPPPQVGKGAGPPNGGSGVPCPPDVCRDFNFKVSGCARPNCSYKHTCAVCGANHPCRGNH